MLRLNSTSILLCLLILIGCISEASGQTNSTLTLPEGTFRTKNVTDYGLELEWLNLYRPVNSNSNCLCNTPSNSDPAVQLQIITGTIAGSNLKNLQGSVNQVPASGSTSMISGFSTTPVFQQGVNHSIAVFMFLTGSRGPNCGLGCDEGGPYAWQLSFMLEDLRPPSNLVASDQTNLTKIRLSWDKATAVPDDQHYYVIARRASSGDPWVPIGTTQDGSEREFWDEGLTPDKSYEYSVQTVRHFPGNKNFLLSQSERSTKIGRTLGTGFIASKGEYLDRVKLEWDPNLAADIASIRVDRSVPGSDPLEFEELAIISKYSSAYNDYDAIPGYRYTYNFIPLLSDGTRIITSSSDGWRKNKGIIRGQITARNRAGIGNVQVCAVPLNSVRPAGAYPIPAGGYCTTTSSSGRFEIRGVYFFDSASFKVTPTYLDHEFDPGADTIILDLNTSTVSGLNFSDTTAILVEGKVSFPPSSAFLGANGDSVPVVGATILVNGDDRGVQTTGDGSWSYALPENGTFSFKPVLHDHVFLDYKTGLDSIRMTINEDITGLDFQDISVDSVKVRAQNACGDPLTQPNNPVRVEVVYAGGANRLNAIFPVDAQGKATVILPKAPFTFSADISENNNIGLDPNAGAQIRSKDFTFDLTIRDSIQITKIVTETEVVDDTTIVIGDPANPDTTYVIPGYTRSVDVEVQEWIRPQPQVDFLYYGPFKVSLDWGATEARIVHDCVVGASSAGDSLIAIQSGNLYLLPIHVIDSITGCAVDTGQVVVYDFIGDKENNPVSIPISKGKLIYPLVAGEPNTTFGGAFPFQKQLFFLVEAGTRKAEGRTTWAVIEGANELTPTFTSRSPQIVDLVVHDPPGNASYSWIEKGSSRSIFQKVQFSSLSTGKGGYFDAIIGAKTNWNAGFGYEPGFSIGGGLELGFNRLRGTQGEDTKGYLSTYTFTEKFSTSESPLFTGHDGDVYIGKSTNQKFSIAKVLLLNDATCEVDIQNRPNLELGEVATTFIYTERHIENFLIPQLNFLELTLKRQASRESDPGEKQELLDEAAEFAATAENWRREVAKNDSNRTVRAVFQENISFSSGAPYERTENWQWDTVRTHQYLDFLNNDFKIGAKVLVDIFAWLETSGGSYSEMQMVTMPADQQHRNTDTTDIGTFEVGYHLDDTDYGDFFSVDIMEDEAFGVPAFQIFAGTSSCPHEDGTQPRDKAEINVFPPRVDNVPVGESAVMTAALIGKSESLEQREYHVRVIGQTNLNGATIRLGGYDITNRPASFFLDTLVYELPLEVIRGPRAASYENIGIMIYPPCEYEIWQANGNVTGGDTMYITVNFETECSPVAIVNPGNNWFINSSTPSALTVDLGGYERKNRYLESLTLEMKGPGFDWKDVREVPITSIADDIHRLILAFDTLPNGQYHLRARANCRDGRGFTRSDEIVGIVDLNSTAPFGRPFPTDGYLRTGQPIYVQFDQPMDTAFASYPNNEEPSITLYRTDNNKDVPFTIVFSPDSTEMLIQPTVDIFGEPDWEGVELEARVEGVRSGIGPNFEPMTYPIVWQFFVNKSPMIWSPSYVNSFHLQGASPVLSSQLLNQTGSLKSFDLSRYPDWLNPSDTTGNVVPFGVADLSFSVDPDLAPGEYKDTVTAMIDGLPEFLTVELVIDSRPPNWQVSPSDFRFAMNGVFAFSLDQSNTNLSRDSLDRIAAIYNGEVRGLAQLEYVRQFDKYMAFMTIYANIPANEEIQFHLWREKSGETFLAGETVYFSDQSMVGSINQPKILHPVAGFQEIPLEQGWNWVSLNIENSDMTIHNMLSSLASPQVGNNIVVKRKDGKTGTFTQVVSPLIYSNQWTNSLEELDNEQMYMIHLSNSPDTLYVPGNPISNFSNIDVFSGWNWIGFQPQEPQPVSQALSSINLRNNARLISQDAFSEYHRGTDTWYGPVKFMEPGQGYKLELRYRNNGTPISYNDLVYSRLGLEDFKVAHGKYASSMTLIGRIGLEESDLERERLLVGAFIEDSCRGYGFVEYVEFLDDYRVIFSFHGNASDIGREVQFRIYDTRSGQEFAPDNAPEVYITDRILGSMTEPYVLFEKLSLPEAGYLLRQNYPNPYDSRTTISFILPQEEYIQLSVYDQFGKRVATLLNEKRPAGEHNITFDAEKLPSGVYHYTLEAGEYRATRKMIKLN